ncbi:crotonase [Desulfosarcina ovata subsp. sediminis]|uniref:Crotonase n=3 Tax=Desulfosarcina ovata TaxID=83564 RepID=A0A5K8ABC6_9BACT|nr:crotonase [Desulfosarcina ovata subsp. sediminis]BBO89250.1 crotonase [Desulfosarcina ovata subsp. ovata]
MNALSKQLLQELGAAMEEIAEDEEANVVIITSQGKAFCAGADIAETDLSAPNAALKTTKVFRTVFNSIEALPKPVIAAVNGFALGGGCELALACDLRIASDKASFAFPEVKLGLIPGAGGTQRLPRIIGMSNALEMLLTGKRINAEEAYRFGLVNRVVPADNLLEEARNLAGKLAAVPPLGIGMAKTAVRTGMNMDIGSALELEQQCFRYLTTTKDYGEERNAFLDK